MDHQSVIHDCCDHRSIWKKNVKMSGNCTQMAKSDLAGLFWFVCCIPLCCLGRKLTRAERKNPVKWMFLLAAVTPSLPWNHPGWFLPLLDPVTRRCHSQSLLLSTIIHFRANLLNPRALASSKHLLEHSKSPTDKLLSCLLDLYDGWKVIWGTVSVIWLGGTNCFKGMICYWVHW